MCCQCGPRAEHQAERDLVQAVNSEEKARETNHKGSDCGGDTNEDLQPESFGQEVLEVKPEPKADNGGDARVATGVSILGLAGDGLDSGVGNPERTRLVGEQLDHICDPARCGQ